MRSGIMYGAAAMLDGMIERMEEELGKSTTVVATGGMAQFVAPPVQAGDEGGEGPAAEGPERHLQEKQEINAKAAGTAGGLVLL